MKRTTQTALITEIAEHYGLTPMNIVAIHAMMGGGIQGGEPDDPPKDPPPDPKPEPAPAAGGADWEAKAKAAEERAQKLEAAEKKRKADETAAKKAAEDEEAKKRGEFEQLLAKKDEELKAAQGGLTALQAAAQARVERMIEKLDDAGKAEIELVKEGLPIDKLEALVEKKIEAAGGGGGTKPTVPPAPGVPGGGASKKDGKRHEIHAETHMILDKAFIPQHRRAVGAHLGAFPIGDGDMKWRWKGTGDESKDTMAFIELLNQIAHNPLREVHDEKLKRIEALG